MKSFQTTTREDNPEAALSILEFSKLFPEFTVVKRIYWITNNSLEDQFRGGHYHPDKQEVLWVMTGSCRFVLKSSIGEDEIVLTANEPKCLFIRPQVYHRLYLKPGTVVAVASPKHYSQNEAVDDNKYLEYKWVA